MAHTAVALVIGGSMWLAALFGGGQPLQAYFSSSATVSMQITTGEWDTSAISFVTAAGDTLVERFVFESEGLPIPWTTTATHQLLPAASTSLQSFVYVEIELASQTQYVHPTTLRITAEDIPLFERTFVEPPGELIDLLIPMPITADSLTFSLESALDQSLTPVPTAFRLQTLSSLVFSPTTTDPQLFIRTSSEQLSGQLQAVSCTREGVSSNLEQTAKDEFLLPALDEGTHMLICTAVMSGGSHKVLPPLIIIVDAEAPEPRDSGVISEGDGEFTLWYREREFTDPYESLELQLYSEQSGVAALEPLAALFSDVPELVSVQSNGVVFVPFKLGAEHLESMVLGIQLNQQDAVGNGTTQFVSLFPLPSE